MGDPTDAERSAAKAGHRLGKLGYPVTESPYAPADHSPEAVAWRRGWTLGNQAHREAIERERRQPLFFGTHRRAGHYWWSSQMAKAHLDADDAGFPHGHIDGRFTPTENTTQGAAALVHLDGWTVLAVHDYSVDSRPGSNAAFLVPTPDLGLDDVLAAAAEHFPSVLERLGPVRLVEHSGSSQGADGG